MPGPKCIHLSPEKRAALRRDLLANPQETATSVGERVGVSKYTAQAERRQMAKEGLVSPEQVEVRPAVPEEAPTPAEVRDSAFWRRRAAAEAKRADDAEHVLREMSGMFRRDLVVPEWTLPGPGKQGKAAGLIHLSDLHVGEVVRGEEVGGVNEYNPEIFKRRFRRMISASMQILPRWAADCDLEGVVVALNGDTVSGSIHQELRETNALTAHEQVALATDEIAAALHKLADQFGAVLVTVTPGNHGRCLEETTEILTATGWVAAKDVSFGHKLASLNLSTRTISFNAPLAINAFTEQGAWKIAGHYRSELVSRDHKVIFDGRLTSVEAVPEESKAAHFEVGVDGFGNSITEEDDYIRLVGWTVFDGTVVDRTAHGESGFRIQWKLKKPRKVAALKALLARMRISFTENANEGATIIRVYSDWARRIAADVGPSMSKRLPERFAHLDKRGLLMLLEVALETDARLSGDAIELSTINKSCVDIIQAACAVNGVHSFVKLNEHPTDYANRKPIYTVRVRPTGLSRRSLCHRVYKSWVDGTFNFVGLQSVDGTLITRRDGKVCVTGNSTEKTHAKRMAALSYDTMIGNILAREFASDERVTVNMSAGADLVFPLLGWSVLQTHGDSMGTGGGQGFAGPELPIVRGGKKIKLSGFASGERYDIMLTAHYHTSSNPGTMLANGSMVGYSEYAVRIRGVPEPPMQWLALVHEKWGLRERVPVVLEDPKPPERPRIRVPAGMA